MEYTKGEWTHEGDGLIVAEDGKQIAALTTRDREDNAHLIAAAPAMYEALKELEDLTKPYDRKAHERIIQAIREAEGKEGSDSEQARCNPGQPRQMRSV